MNKFILGSILLLTLSACGPNAFQPPGNAYETWSKPRATQLDIKKSMLECGMDNPMGLGVGKFDLNEYLLKQRCMESLGYLYDNKKACKGHSKEAACQPDTVIPQPSVELRLNSSYCKRLRSFEDPKKLKICLYEKKLPEEVCRDVYSIPRLECYP